MAFPTSPLTTGTLYLPTNSRHPNSRHPNTHPHPHPHPHPLPHPSPSPKIPTTIPTLSPLARLEASLLSTPPDGTRLSTPTSPFPQSPMSPISPTPSLLPQKRKDDSVVEGENKVPKRRAGRVFDKDEAALAAFQALHAGSPFAVPRKGVEGNGQVVNGGGGERKGSLGGFEVQVKEVGARRGVVVRKGVERVGVEGKVEGKVEGER